MIIAHRALLRGPDFIKENTIDSINECIRMNINIELDIRYIDGNWYLGHDHPQEIIDLDTFDFGFVHVFFHCKNIETLNRCCNTLFKEQFEGQIDFFYHDQDSVTLTKNGLIWSYPKSKLFDWSICVMPELVSKKYFEKTINKYNDSKIYAICTDYPLIVQQNLNKKIIMS